MVTAKAVSKIMTLEAMVEAYRNDRLTQKQLREVFTEIVKDLEQTLRQCGCCNEKH